MSRGLKMEFGFAVTPAKKDASTPAKASTRKRKGREHNEQDTPSKRRRPAKVKKALSKDTVDPGDSEEEDVEQDTGGEEWRWHTGISRSESTKVRRADRT
jgi:hypothetical protein